MADKRKTRRLIGGIAVVAILAVGGVLLLGGGNGTPPLEITGTVFDQATGQPIASARVSDDGYGPKPYQGAITDSEGRYRYLTWPEEHTIVAEAPGYKPRRHAIDTGPLQSAEELVMVFYLEPATE